MDANPVQLSNAPAPMEVTLLGMVTDDNLVQYLNARVPMVVTVLGMAMELKAQSWKVYSLIALKFEGKDTLVKTESPSKACFSIVVVLPLNVAVFKEAQEEKAYSPTYVMLPGMVMVNKPES